MAEINNIISVGISDLKVSTAPNILATYALGSCVGICLLDAKKHIGGLAHIMLPWSLDAKTNNENTRKYADTGIKELIDTMLKYGADSSHINAKIAGGAQMFQSQLHAFNVGKRNVEAVKKTLATYKIRIVAEDTGLNFGRTVFFHINTGVMQVKSATNKVVLF